MAISEKGFSWRRKPTGLGLELLHLNPEQKTKKPKRQILFIKVDLACHVDPQKIVPEIKNKP